MKIEESKYYVKQHFDGMMENPQVILDPKYIEAERMAIASLEAWEKVKAEIDAYLVAEEFGTAYRQDIRAIIDKHLQEVTE